MENNDFKDKDIRLKIEYLKRLKKCTNFRRYVYYNLRNLTLCNGALKGEAIDMMRHNRLKNWCYEATTSMIPFFKDEDKLVRGALKYHSDDILKHSWIVINYLNKQYVLDPALEILVQKEQYYRVFSPYILTTMSSKKVEQSFINQIENKKVDLLADRITINGSDDINNPFYGADLYVRGKVKNKKIKKLDVYFDSF